MSTTITPSIAAISTPRTDEQINGKPCTRFAVLAGNSLRDALVPASFARTLETELTDAKAERDLAITRVASILWSGAIDKHTCGDVQKWVTDYTAEIARLRAELALLREWQRGVIQNENAHHAERKEAIARAERAEAELAEDKARLDWLGDNADQIHCSKSVGHLILQYWIAPTRAAIDAAMEDTEPMDQLMRPDKTQCTDS